MKSVPRSRFAAAAAAVLLAIAAFGCQEKSSSLSASFLTVDTKNFDVHSVTRLSDQQNTSLDNYIVLVRTKYTNTDILPEFLAPEHFILFDPHAGQEFVALSGGDISVPAFQSQAVQPGQSAEIVVAFRVPNKTISGRLSYKP